MTNRLTKNDMARVVVQALFNLEELPSANDVTVETMVRIHNKKWFLEWHPKAIKILMENQRRKREKEDKKS